MVRPLYVLFISTFYFTKLCRKLLYEEGVPKFFWKFCHSNPYSVRLKLVSSIPVGIPFCESPAMLLSPDITFLNYQESAQGMWELDTKRRRTTFPVFLVMNSTCKGCSQKPLYLSDRPPKVTSSALSHDSYGTLQFLYPLVVDVILLKINTALLDLLSTKGKLSYHFER